MTTAKRFGLLLDLVLLAASLTTGGPVAEQVRMIGSSLNRVGSGGLESVG
jgi:hypothetical protein